MSERLPGVGHYPGFTVAVGVLGRAANDAPRIDCGNLRCKHDGRPRNECKGGVFWLTFDANEGEMGVGLWEVEVTVNDFSRNFASSGSDPLQLVEEAWRYVFRATESDESAPPSTGVDACRTPEVGLRHDND